jgi:hypothetical protein
VVGVVSLVAVAETLSAVALDCSTMSEDPTTRDTEGEWLQPRTEGVYVSAAGKYCCEECEAVLKPTGERVDERTWNPEVWECPECESRYDI